MCVWGVLNEAMPLEVVTLIRRTTEYLTKPQYHGSLRDSEGSISIVIVPFGLLQLEDKALLLKTPHPLATCLGGTEVKLIWKFAP